jgi:hypothetical protein
MKHTMFPITDGQLDKTIDLLVEKAQNPERYQILLESGCLADLYEADLTKVSRDVIRRALGLAMLPSDPNFLEVNYNLSLIHI